MGCGVPCAFPLRVTACPARLAWPVQGMPGRIEYMAVVLWLPSHAACPPTRACCVGGVGVRAPPLGLCLSSEGCQSERRPPVWGRVTGSDWSGNKFRGNSVYGGVMQWCADLSHLEGGRPVSAD